MRRKMVKTASLRAWVALTIVAVLMLTFCGVALAAPKHTVPNSGASHNCVATSSGVLYFREHGDKLGQDVSKVAPHGGQREWVQEAVHESC
jgi:hypothetical protein